MKKYFVMIAVLAIAVPAMAADFEGGATRAVQPLQILSPGGAFNTFSLSPGCWPPDIDTWPILCLGGGTLNVSISDFYVPGNVIFAAIYEVLSGSWSLPNGCLTPCTFTLTESVTGTGAFFLVFVGYLSDCSAEGYDIRVAYTP